MTPSDLIGKHIYGAYYLPEYLTKDKVLHLEFSDGTSVDITESSEKLKEELAQRGAGTLNIDGLIIGPIYVKNLQEELAQAKKENEDLNKIRQSNDLGFKAHMESMNREVERLEKENEELTEKVDELHKMVQAQLEENLSMGKQMQDLTSLAESHRRIYELLSGYGYGGNIDTMHDDLPCPDDVVEALTHAQTFLKP